MSEKNVVLPPKRGDLIIHEAQDGEQYICIGWIGPFIVLMSIKKGEPFDQFWFENWENTGEEDFTSIPLPEPVREAWTKILPETITPTSETYLKF